MKIGFFDSGIGGMSVLYEAIKVLPYEDYIFYADTLNVPYGEKSKIEVREYIFNAVEFLAAQNIKALVIACNTATSIAVEDLRRHFDFPIIGIEPAVRPAIKKCAEERKRVLVVATHLTLKEEKFHHLVKEIDHHALVDCLALPGLVEFAENFDFSEDKVIKYLKNELSSFDLKQYGTIVLGCTHFPFFKNSFEKLFGINVDIISGSVGTAKQLKKILVDRNQLGKGSGSITFFNSGHKIEDQEIISKYKTLFKILDGNQGSHVEHGIYGSGY
ncbi:glutamate racemase [Bacillus cabrialesii]|uniref:Glutamate racemase n=1 Tax=Bacillus cabrialesii subsp. tritici TaxID=2944916 RepID=A0ABT9DML1_9BACI|nr:glutamate racemase [Bacillus cabrialesii]MDO8225900.1 glutamate racemase [Bacillus cabrialesii subsp. tritici]RJS56674.1 glutamate racemase [Bacillus subtilis]